MTSKEYVIWFKGFVEACESQPTSKQWDVLKDKLAEITDAEQIGTSIGGGGFGIPNTIPMWQQPHTINPYYIGDIPQVNLPFISTTPNGTGGNPIPPTCTISTTPGSSSISVASGFGGLTTSIPGIGGSSTVTQWNPNKGNWNYTNI
jgi:hypothetical protein